MILTLNIPCNCPWPSIHPCLLDGNHLHLKYTVTHPWHTWSLWLEHQLPPTGAIFDSALQLQGLAHSSCLIVYPPKKQTFIRQSYWKLLKRCLSNSQPLFLFHTVTKVQTLGPTRCKFSFASTAVWLWTCYWTSFETQVSETRVSECTTHSMYSIA